MPEVSRPVRVLVIRAGALGDTVCASSIIEPLRIEFGEDVHIEWVAKAGMGSLFAADPRIKRVHELKNRRLPLPFNAGKRAIVHHSRQTPFDYVINLELGPLFNDLVRHVDARHRIGMPFHYFAEPPEAHAVVNLQLIYRSVLGADALARAWPCLRGLPEETLRQRFDLPASWHVLVPANSHIGKGHRLNHRAWPLAHWRELLEKLDAKGLPTVLVGAPSDRPLLEALHPLPPSTLDLIGRTDFPELIGLIQAARGVVATDTGPAHVAAAVNTPVISLIGPTNPKRTAPYPTPENRVEILSAGLDCSPCYHTPALEACENNRCMQLITTSRVLMAMENLP